MRRLIAVVGMSGSGKSIATDYLENEGWTKLYFGGITYKLMAEAGVERTPDGKSEKEFRENLRREHGPECYAKFLEPDIKKALETNDVVLDGLYSWYDVIRGLEIAMIDLFYEKILFIEMLRKLRI